MNRILLGQYEAAISMLRDAIASCPPQHWEAKLARLTTRVIAFHTLFWTDMYLTPRKADFQSHELVTEGRGVSWPEKLPEGAIPPGLSQPRALEYADYCIAKAQRILASQTEQELAAPNGFGATFSRAEMHIYNIRHIQHHAGALAAHIRRLSPELPEEAMDWIDTGTMRLD